MKSATSPAIARCATWSGCCGSRCRRATGWRASAALLLPLPLGRAWERLEAMRRTVATQPFAPEHGAELMRLTFSAGIASWPQDGADLSQLLRRADLRLRHAKLEGRNRVLARDP